MCQKSANPQTSEWFRLMLTLCSKTETIEFKYKLVHTGHN